MSIDLTQCGSLDRASLKSVERFVRAMTVTEVLGCKSEGDILSYEIKWDNSWIDEKIFRELFDCASSLIESFSSTKFGMENNYTQASQMSNVPQRDQIPVVEPIENPTRIKFEVHNDANETIHEEAKGTLYMCDMCSVGFYSHKSLSDHRLNCPGNYQMTAPRSETLIESKGVPIFRSMKDESEYEDKPVTNMIMKMHNSTMYECEICHMTFADEDYLRRHKVRCKNHSNSEFRCSICQRGFTTKGSLELHVSAVHLKQKDFGCSICGKLFSRKHILKLHLATHYGERNYKCSTCGKTFVQKSNYSRHLRIHESKNFGYKCRYCGQAFTQNKHVQKHVSTFHPDKYESTYNESTYKESTYMNEVKYTVESINGTRPFTESINGPQPFTESINGPQPFTESINGPQTFTEPING